MKLTAKSAAANSRRAGLESLVAGWQALEAGLRQGGGADKIQKQQQQGKLTARERHALSRADRLPGGFGRPEFAVSERRFPWAIRRSADFLLQLDYAPLPRSVCRSVYGFVVPALAGRSRKLHLSA